MAKMVPLTTVNKFYYIAYISNNLIAVSDMVIMAAISISAAMATLAIMDVRVRVTLHALRAKNLW